MRSIVFVIALFVIFFVQAENKPGLIPLPQEIVENQGQFIFNAKIQWIAENQAQEKVLSQLMERFEVVAGWSFNVKTGKRASSNSVSLKTNSSIAPEGYKLKVSPKRILIEASTANGFFYGIQTLRQLLPASINGSRFVKGEKWSVPCVSISDAPRFGYRGFMLDVSRFFMPKKDILRLIDFLAFHKINTFHWHLVDDNGWRIEIKKYPRLTDISSWRAGREAVFPMRSNAELGEPVTTGGYYTQEDIKEVVAYAQERFVEIIPEIEMPAHTNSSLAAYPNLTCPVINHYIGVITGIGGKNASTIYCAGNDSVFTFLQDVLSEVMTLFPSKYIHIGGDEATKDNWKICPKCQARMKENGIQTEEELQSYFIRRINKFLISKGKQLMGWDELVESEIPENAVIFGWRGLGTGAYKAGEKGFKYIMSPAQKYYYIRYQGPQWFEPYTYFGNTTLQDVYLYEPQNEKLLPETANRMMGVESCLWTEFIKSTNEADYQIFPRFAAFAESAWSNPHKKNWNDFLSRLDNLLKAYDFLGINYSRSMYNLSHKVTPIRGMLEVELLSIRSDVKIRYTLDGSEPKSESVLYNGKLMIKPGEFLRAATFKGGKLVGAILPLHTINNKATGHNAFINNTPANALTNGILGSEKVTDGEWLDFNDKDVVMTIDMDSMTICSSIKLGIMNNSGMGIHLPKNVQIDGSEDGKSFKTLLEKSYTMSNCFQNGLFRQTENYDFPKCRIRYLRLSVQNPGLCPQGHVREGQKSRMAFDEVIVD